MTGTCPYLWLSSALKTGRGSFDPNELPHKNDGITRFGQKNHFLVKAVFEAKQQQNDIKMR